MRFEAIVLARTQSSLHMDFDRFGVDFSSITVEFRAPPEWAGLSADLHYQGEPGLDGLELAVGSSFGFIAIPPDCLHQLWFLLAATK